MTKKSDRQMKIRMVNDLRKNYGFDIRLDKKMKIVKGSYNSQSN